MLTEKNISDKYKYCEFCGRTLPKHYEMLFIQNPYKVIEDKEISIESPRKYEKSKGFFKKLFKK